MSATSIHFPPANSHQRCQDSGTQKAGGVSGDKFASSSLVYSEVKRILLISRLPILKLMNSFGEDGFKPWELFFCLKKSSPKCFMTIGFTWVSVARFLLTMAWFILQVHELSGWCQLVSGRPYYKEKLAELWSSLAEWSTTIFKLESNYIKWKNMICTKDKVSIYIH